MISQNGKTQIGEQQDSLLQIPQSSPNSAYQAKMNEIKENWNRQVRWLASKVTGSF